ncbi:MAG TPA: hypothetical protein VGS00_09210 [Thermoanaerobaculia bacterium]|nr:hypothetical protein [Thermoanaerobaculia bacterium]
MPPRRGRPLFEVGRMNGNVVLNFQGRPKSELSAYGSAFWRAANALAERLVRAGYKDTDACPIVFLYRHSIELYLKAIAYRGRDLLTLDRKKLHLNPKAETKHPLRPLIEAAEEVFRELDWPWDTQVEGARTLPEVKALIGEIEAYDPESFSFRYPIDKRGNASSPKHFGFNVLRVAERLDGLLGLLDGAADALEGEWHGRCEARAEAFGETLDNADGEPFE